METPDLVLSASVTPNGKSVEIVVSRDLSDAEWEKLLQTGIAALHERDRERREAAALPVEG